jgi:hypothetical protein
MKKISKFNKYRLTQDLPSYRLKRGAVFEWSDDDNCFITHSLPWFLSPLVTRSQMRRKIFELVE